MPVKALADLGRGARGRIVEPRLPPGRRTSPPSPLQEGDQPPSAADAYAELAADAAALDAAAFRRRYRLP